MIELGRYNNLKVVKTVDFGVYLGSDDDKVLLPASQVPEGTKQGDELKVFIYRDSSDRLIATVMEPLIELGGVKRLVVKDVNKVGAFLDWGLPKDLFMPYKEQKKQLKPGDSVLVACYIDKSDRLCATMKIYDYLSNESPYKAGDEVKGCIYDINKSFGAFVAIDDHFNAMIPKSELFGSLEIGSEISARVVKRREDGKLDLSVRDKSYVQIDRDCLVILDRLNAGGGRLDLCDKSDPEIIKSVINMTKNQFKRAVGRLYKEGRIDLKEGYIILRK